MHKLQKMSTFTTSIFSIRCWLFLCLCDELAHTSLWTSAACPSLRRRRKTRKQSRINLPTTFHCIYLSRFMGESWRSPPHPVNSKEDSIQRKLFYMNERQTGAVTYSCDYKIYIFIRKRRLGVRGRYVF